MSGSAVGRPRRPLSVTTRQAALTGRQTPGRVPEPRAREGICMRGNRLFLVVALTLVAGLMAMINAPSAQSSAAGTFLVVYRGNSVPKDAASVMTKAGGTLVYSYDAIGVAIAKSTDPSFRGSLLKDSRIEGASATGNFGIRLDEADLGNNSGALESPAPSNSGDSLSHRQWDMDQIKAPEAHEISTG